MENEIPDDVLHELKCIQCENFLSCSPVRINRDGESICGRCTPTTKEFARNVAYETVARRTRFPCRYRERGCEQRHDLMSMKRHEDNCKHVAKSICPVFRRGCHWNGAQEEIREHCLRHHGDMMAEHPCKLEINARQRRDRCFFVTVREQLFLVQLNYSSRTRKLWHCVRFIGKPEKASTFQYVMCVTSSIYQCRKKFAVQPTISESSIGGDDQANWPVECITYTDGSMEIQIETNESCKSMELTDRYPIAKNDEGFQCSDSREPDGSESICFINRCKNFDEGCSSRFADELDTTKHVDWLCRFGEKQCRFCWCKFKDKSLMNHYLENHVKFEGFDFLVVDNLDLRRPYHAILKHSGSNTVFYCYWSVNSKLLDFKVVSNVTHDLTKNFTSYLRIRNPRTGFVVRESKVADKAGENISSRLYYDWSIFWEINLANCIHDDKYSIDIFIEPMYEEIEYVSK